MRLAQEGARIMNEQIKNQINELLPNCEDTQMLDLIRQLLIKSINNGLRHIEPVVSDAV